MAVLCLVVVLDVLSLYLPAKLFSGLLTGLLDSDLSTCVSPLPLRMLGATYPFWSRLLILVIPCSLDLETIVFSLVLERVVIRESLEGSLPLIIEGLFLVSVTDASVFGYLGILLIPEVLVDVLGLVDGVRGVMVFLSGDKGRELLTFLGFKTGIFDLLVTGLLCEPVVDLGCKIPYLFVIELFDLEDFDGVDFPVILDILFDGV